MYIFRTLRLHDFYYVFPCIPCQKVYMQHTLMYANSGSFTGSVIQTMQDCCTGGILRIVKVVNVYRLHLSKHLLYKPYDFTISYC